MKSIIAILALFFVVACSGASKQEGTTGGKKGSENLCKEYKSCKECIAGLMKNRGLDHGKAQTECSLASSGCWVTWEKPIKCD